MSPSFQQSEVLRRLKVWPPSWVSHALKRCLLNTKRHLIHFASRMTSRLQSCSWGSVIPNAQLYDCPLASKTVEVQQSPGLLTVEALGVGGGQHLLVSGRSPLHRKIYTLDFCIFLHHCFFSFPLAGEEQQPFFIRSFTLFISSSLVKLPCTYLICVWSQSLKKPWNYDLASVFFFQGSTLTSDSYYNFAS